MDQYLAQYFGNAPSSPTSEDLEKSAQADLFMKLAESNGIDLEQLNDQQVAQLWEATFSKTAAPFEGKETAKEEKEEEEAEGKDEKKEKAKEELSEKKAAAEKFAEATEMGKIMAHSYVAELREIAKTAQAQQEQETALPEILKIGSALDQLAGELALMKVAEAGWNVEEAAARINSVLTLGLGESEKIAANAANLDVDAAAEIRSLEFLQAAGYPVTWNQ